MTAKVTLKSLKFYAGPSPGLPGLSISVPTITILVGPNNSGKSLALREIEKWCWNEEETRLVVDKIEIGYPANPDDALSLVRAHKGAPPSGQGTAPDHVWIALPTFKQDNQTIHEQISEQAIRSAVTNSDLSWIRHGLARLYTIRLDGRTRFSLSDPKPSGDLQIGPRNHLWALFVNDVAREKVRKITELALKLHFVVDPTAMTQFRVRMSKRAPQDKAEEQSLDDRARAFHGAAELISNLSDGVQTFTGLTSAILSLPHTILLVDEPEAFLHPPLARRLGRDLATIAKERGASALFSTHSAEFLMGAIEGTEDLRIVRFTYEQGRASARSVEPAALKELMKDPLLRSAQALRGLFHHSMIVSEADRDRAFYEEINSRLQANGGGIDDCLFVNAQNWQTIPRIAIPLRRLGVPCAAIIDFDVLESEPWKPLLDMIHADSATQSRLAAERTRIASHLRSLPLGANGQKTFKTQGLGALAQPNLASVEAFINELSEYGLFIVPFGEVERWLNPLGVQRDPKKTWLSRMFDALGTDPVSAGYVHPGVDDVWAFMGKIRAWIEDPNRKGIPSS